MHLSYLVLSALPLLALANPLQLTLSINEGPNEITHKLEHDRVTDSPPGWLKDDRSRIVPLTPRARQGDIDPLTEEGLIALDGEMSGGNVTAEGNCFTCALTVAKAMPCLYKCLKSGNPADCLKCGIGKPQLCGCSNCLPKTIGDWIRKHLCNNAAIEADEGEGISPYVDWMAVGANSNQIQAFRGDLYKYQVEEIKSLYSYGGNLNGICDPCGSCKCCIGACVLNKCIGVCPFEGTDIDMVSRKTEL